MHTVLRIPAAALALVLSAAAQDLPPGILLLARVKAHLRQDLAHLPNCSCTETVHRQFRPARGKLRPLDVVRIDVLYSGGRELYAPPGDRRFTAEHPSAFAGSGAIGDGYFAWYLTDIIDESRTSYEYKGEEDLNGRRLARYEYRVPMMFSGHQINTVEGSGTVGASGSFWADPATFDIVRLEVRASDIPPFLPVAESVHTIDYGRVALGENQFLLPRMATTRFVKLSGEESINRMEFTQCHLFEAESSINFGMKEERPQFATTAALETPLLPLPELEITAQLVTPITPDTVVGSLIEATVTSSVPRKGKVLIPEGSVMRGRVRRLEWNEEKGGYYIVGLEFKEVDAGGLRYRVFADLEYLDRKAGVDFTLITDTSDRVTGQTREVLTLPPLSGAGVFFVRGQKLNLPKGFRMVWKTRIPPK